MLPLFIPLRSTQNEDGKRDSEVHQTKKVNQYFFGMKAHIGADLGAVLVHHVRGAAVNVADFMQPVYAVFCLTHGVVAELDLRIQKPAVGLVVVHYQNMQ